MRLHANAALSLNKRRQLCRRVVHRRWSLAEAAAAAEVSERTASKWVGRYRAEGEPGLLDRSSAPRRVASRTDELRRRSRRCGACASPGEISQLLGMALSTVSRWLRRIGLGKLSRLAPPEPANRYERKRPGELIHMDIKKLGRIEVAPYRESGYRLLMETLARRGNSAEALIVYEQLRTVLRDALGAAPSSASQALHRRLLGQTG